MQVMFESVATATGRLFVDPAAPVMRMFSKLITLLPFGTLGAWRNVAGMSRVPGRR